MYKVYRDGKEVYSSHDEDDVDHFIEMEVDAGIYNSWEFNVVKVFGCKGCGEYKDDVQERSDAYGIFTGHYCENCYENHYPYRKDRYETIEFHGEGERLEDDY